jgi:hypothetical protein
VIGPSGIAPLAQRQLAAWQAIAAKWTIAKRDDQMACGKCDGAVMALADQHGTGYRISSDVILAAVVMHLRACHAEVEPAGL